MMQTNSPTTLMEVLFSSFIMMSLYDESNEFGFKAIEVCCQPSSEVNFSLECII